MNDPFSTRVVGLTLAVAVSVAAVAVGATYIKGATAQVTLSAPMKATEENIIRTESDAVLTRRS